MLQTKPAGPQASTGEAPGIVHEVLRSPGQPLDTPTRAYFEPRLSHGFSHVRVYADDRADASAHAVGALAYTVGQRIVFAAGQFAPETEAGRRLLAHELTHVVQQDGSSSQLMCQTPGAPTLPLSPLTLPSEGIEMPWVGKGENVNSSELGYLRDAAYFWERFQSRYPQQISPQNAQRIASGASPIVDATWVQSHPEHGSYLNQTLEHHHVGQGSRAVPLPEQLHDAYTVFHPQRRVVSTPSGGTRPLPPQPTRAQHQAEINRHIRQGRIYGPGITPQTPPQAPAIPLGSELAGVAPSLLVSQAPKPTAPAEPLVSQAAPKPAAPAEPLVSQAAPKPAAPAEPLVSQAAPKPTVPAEPLVSQAAPKPAVPAEPLVSQAAPVPASTAGPKPRSRVSRRHLKARP
jgi:hypothetical protein